MLGTYNRKQRLSIAHPWISNKQATQLLTHKYYYFLDTFDKQQIQSLMDNFTTICCYSSEHGLRDLIPRSQEWW